MAEAVTEKMTVETFDAWVQHPQNIDKTFEYIAGEVYEVPSNAEASRYSAMFVGEFYIYNKVNNLGYITTEAGGYIVNGERYAPDVAFIRLEKGPLARQGYHPQPPDLVVEIDLPTTYQSQQNLRYKVVNYLAAGVTVWLVLPENRAVEVYAPGQAIRYLGLEDTLDGGAVLPGFRLAVRSVFMEGDADG